MLDFALEKFDVLHSGLALIFTRKRQHFIRHIEAVGFARGPDPPRRKQHVDAAARAEIETVSPALSCASAVGLPQPSEASTASSGRAPVCAAS